MSPQVVHSAAYNIRNSKYGLCREKKVALNHGRSLMMTEFSWKDEDHILQACGANRGLIFDQVLHHCPQHHCQQGFDSVAEHQTRDLKIMGLIPNRIGRQIFFSRNNFLCCLLFWCPFHSHVAALAWKRPGSFCQKCSRTL